jgi:hypothetical protein
VGNCTRALGGVTRSRSRSEVEIVAMDAAISRSADHRFLGLKSHSSGFIFSVSLTSKDAADIDYDDRNRPIDRAF